MVHAGVTYPCGECSSVLKTRRNLAGHIRDVHRNAKYPCGHCDFQASSTGNLSLHRRSVHEGIKFHCSECDHLATSKGNLRRHQRKIHALKLEASLQKDSNDDLSFELKSLIKESSNRYKMEKNIE